MTDFDRKKIELELKLFTTRNFVVPGKCRDSGQIMRYVRELCIKIEDYEQRFNFVPSWAYALLSQYNMAHTRILHAQFRKDYYDDDSVAYRNETGSGPLCLTL